MPTDVHGLTIPEEGQLNAYNELVDAFELADRAPVVGREDELVSTLSDTDKPALGVATDTTPPKFIISEGESNTTTEFSFERVVEERTESPMEIPSYSTVNDIPGDQVTGVSLVYIESENQVHVVIPE